MYFSQTTRITAIQQVPANLTQCVHAYANDRVETENAVFYSWSSHGLWPDLITILDSYFY